MKSATYTPKCRTQAVKLVQAQGLKLEEAARRTRKNAYISLKSWHSLPASGRKRTDVLESSADALAGAQPDGGSLFPAAPPSRATLPALATDSEHQRSRMGQHRHQRKAPAYRGSHEV